MVGPAGSGSSSGGSGGIGAPLSPTQRDVETTAWTEVNKAALGIVHDSIDIAFSQIDHRYSQSHLGTNTGYRAPEDQPLLDHPLESLRVLRSMTPLADESFISTYQELINQLPPGVLERFILEKEKPLNERDPSFVATDNVLMNAARILTAITTLARMPAPDSIEAARVELNALLPVVALRGSIAASNEISTNGQELLQQLGPNYRHFDEVSDILNQMQLLSKNLQRIGDFSSSVNQQGGR